MGRSGGRKKALSRVAVTRGHQSQSILSSDSVVAEIKKIGQEKKDRSLVRATNAVGKLLDSDLLIERLEGETLALDLIEKIAEGDPDFSNPETRKLVEPFFKTARDELLEKVSPEDLEGLSPVETIRLARWQRAINRLLKEETMNSANAFSVISDANGSDDPSEWLKTRLSTKKQLGGLENPWDKENISFQSHLAEAILAVERDPDMREIDQAVRDKEDEIRDQATVFGNRPFDDIIIVPSSTWVSSSEDRSATAVNCQSDGEDFGIDTKHIFVYAGKIKEMSGDAENGTNYTPGDAISNARHELIHSSQAHYIGSDAGFRAKAKRAGIASRSKQDRLATKVKESLTESLNIVRGNAHITDNFSVSGISSVDCSYRDDLNALAQVFDVCQVPLDDRHLALEELNARQLSGVTDFFDRALEKVGSDKNFVELFNGFLPPEERI